MLKLAKHQIEATERGTGKNLALFHDCGTGKTMTALSLYKRNVGLYDNLHLLVVVSPKVLINTSWQDDIRKFCPECTYESFKDYEKTGGEIPDILLINYEYIRIKKNVLKINSIISKHKFMCVLDESTHIKNPKSESWKCLKLIMNRFVLRYVMSGTPAPNTMLDLWTQLSFIQPDLLDRSFFSFRKNYGALIKERNGKQYKADITNINIPAVARSYLQQGYKWVVPQEKVEDLMKVIQPYVHWVKETDVLDLPSQNFQMRSFELSPAEKTAYKQMKNDMILELSSKTVAVDTAVAKIMKLRQVCGGYIYSDGVNIIGDSKLKALEELITSIGTQQAVIWVHFKHDGEIIIKLLEKLKLSYSVIRGGAADKEEQSRKFVNKETQFMVANPASAGHGLTWTNCHVAIYYSMDYNYETYYQSTKRIHRRGQTERCTYYSLAAHDTVEPQIIKALQNKEDAQKLIEELTK